MTLDELIIAVEKGQRIAHERFQAVSFAPNIIDHANIAILEGYWHIEPSGRLASPKLDIITIEDPSKWHVIKE